MRSWKHESGISIQDVGGYDIIYADPPWRYSDRTCIGAAEGHYETMNIEQIAALPVRSLAAKDCALFMWGTYPLLREMLWLGNEWGFEYKSIAFQWVKRYSKSEKPFFGLGRWTRGNTEGCFLFTKGKPKRDSKAVSQLVEDDFEVLDASIGKHSAKPGIVRDRILTLMGDDKAAIELFARERVERWDCWGNQVNQSVTLDVE